MALTLCDQLEAYFKARPGQWLDGMELAHVAGQYAWRSRCSDLRRRGLRIENKQVRVPWGVKSLYRYVPADLLALADGPQEQRA